MLSGERAGATVSGKGQRSGQAGLRRPRWRRWQSAVLVLALSSAGAQAVTYDAQELEVVRLVDGYRQSLGLDPLMVSDLVSDAAEKHSTDMGTYGLNPSNPHVTWRSNFFREGSNAGERMGHLPLLERLGVGGSLLPDREVGHNCCGGAGKTAPIMIAAVTGSAC